MQVRAKFRCVQKTDSATNYGGPSTHESSTVKLQPIYATQGPNKTWSNSTPSGSLEMQITNRAAFDAFKLGKCYYIDFSEAPEEE